MEDQEEKGVIVYNDTVCNAADESIDVLKFRMIPRIEALNVQQVKDKNNDDKH